MTEKIGSSKHKFFKRPCKKCGEIFEPTSKFNHTCPNCLKEIKEDKKKMKSTLICTVYNEEKTIKNLIESILKQTRVPDEILFLDSLSIDSTAEIIKSYRTKGIKLIEQEAEIGTARNILIEKAKNKIIMVTDGGCILHKKWCEEMLKPFQNKNINVVGGVYKPLAKNFFEQCQGMVVCKPIKQIDENKFLPSSRSLAFKKEVWEDVEGYPPHEIGGEDTKFILNIIDEGYEIVINKKAIVNWRMRSPLKNFIRQFYLYGMGDVRSGNISKMRLNIIFTMLFPLYFSVLILSLFSLHNVFLVLFSIPLFYFLYKGFKVANSVKDIRGIYYGALFTFLKRFMYFSGVWAELIFPNRAKYRNENY